MLILIFSTNGLISFGIPFKISSKLLCDDFISFLKIWGSDLFLIIEYKISSKFVLYISLFILLK